MSAQDQNYDEMTQAVMDQRAADAEAWDEMPVTTHPRDVVGDVGEPDILGILSELGAPVGPIQFEGKEDFIRGDDAPACCRGLDILGAVPGQLGFKMGARGLVQQQAAGFVRKNLPGGKSYLAIATKPLAALDFRGAVNKAQLVAKNAKMVATSLKNFKSAPPRRSSPKRPAPRRVVGGDVEWVDIVGDEAIVTTEREWNIQGNGPLLVGEAAAVFDDLIGAAPKKKKRKKASQISDAEVRALARDLEKSADKLSSQAGKQQKKLDAKLAKDKAARVSALRATQVSKAVALKRLPTTTALKHAPTSMLRAPTRAAMAPVRATSAFRSPAIRSGTAASRGVFSSVLGMIGSLFPGGTEETIGPDPYGGTDPYGSGDPYGGYGLDPYAGYTEPELPPGPEDNYGIGEPPTLETLSLVAGVDYTPDPGYEDDGNVYSSIPDVLFGDAPRPGRVLDLPLGKIYYDGQQGWPRDGFTSFARAKAGGGANSGYYNYGGSVGFSGFPGGGPWYRRMGREGGKYEDHSLAGAQDYINLRPFGPSDNWGPLVGNWLAGEWLKGLRLDYGTKRWFWYRDKAPKWATSGEDIDRLNNAVLEYKTDLAKAKSTYLSAVAQAKSLKEDADRRAREWANTQTEMQQQQQVFEQQQQQQMDTMDLQQMQQDAALEQQMMQQEMAMEQQMMQQEAQLAQLDIQREQAETQAYQQWLQSGGWQQEQYQEPQPQFYDEGGNYEGSPFADLDQRSRGGSAGPFDDLSEGQVSDALSVYDEGQYGWED